MPSAAPAVVSRAVRVDLHDRWLRVHFADATGTFADFHYVWLRHNCDHERHPLTGERTLDPSDIPAGLRVLRAHVDADRRVLVVHWDDAPTRPASEYTLDWLLTHAYGLNRADLTTPPPSDLATVTLEGLRHRDAHGLAVNVLDRVARHGLAVVRGFRPGDSATPEDTEVLIRAFESRGLHTVGTHFGRIEDLRTDNTTNQNTDQLGYTDAGIELHTDQPFLADPPRYQMLHAMRAADEGGENFLVDALAAARWLEHTDPEAFSLLTGVPVRFHRKQKAFERVETSPILSFGAGGRFRARYSYFTMAPFSLPFGAMENWYRAYVAFARVVRDRAHQYRFTLQPGDFVLYDNHRMLHARTAFRGPRWVRGVYFDG